MVTGSHDKSIRIWEKTDEPLFLQEERERELEALYDATGTDEGPTNAANGEGGEEVEAVQKSTSETLMAGEKIMEALELADAEREVLVEYESEKARMGDAGESLPQPKRSAELIARGDMAGDEYVYKVIKAMPAAGMEDALLVLPFRQVISLLIYLDEWAKQVRGYRGPCASGCEG